MKLISLMYESPRKIVFSPGLGVFCRVGSKNGKELFLSQTKISFFVLKTAAVIENLT